MSESTKIKILDAASELFYLNGYYNTSFGDIEKSTGLSRGNINYHFKNKKNILQATIDKKLETISKELINYEKKAESGSEAIVAFLRGVLSRRDEIVLKGCHVGTLVSETAKQDDCLSEVSVVMFELYIDWLSKQFMRAGEGSLQVCKKKAISLLAQLQGGAVLSHALKDPSVLKREVDRIKNEVSSL